MEASTNSEPTRRKWKRLILIPALMGLVAGVLVSYAPFFPPKYTATATVLVEGQKVPSQYVQPVITADFAQRVQSLSQQVLSESRLRPVIQSLDLAKPGDEGKLMEQIRANMQVTPVITSMSEAELAGAKKEASPIDEPLPGFNVSYSDKYPERAQKICNAMTSLMLDENLKSRGEDAKGTTDFLGRQVEDAKRTLEALGTQFVELDKKGVSRSPKDEVRHKTLAIEYENAQAVYRDVLAKKSQADLGASMESQALGERMTIAQIAGRPDSPSFPVRPLFSFAGFGTGPVLGIGLALWNRLRPPDYIFDEPTSNAP